MKQHGLIAGSRHYVHLSADSDTATKVGARHGKAVVLIIDTAKMHADGCVFCQAENGVWLTESVAVGYIEFGQFG
ncbi:MAG: RNA 2'-phosphotransferase [Moraxella equi]|nr:RNA 2'-phosphotransferase [Moraxella equi]